MLDSGGRRAKVEVLADGLIDEFLEFGILKDLPPGQVGKRGTFFDGRIDVKGLVFVDFGSFVIRADRTAGDQQGKRDGE